MVKRLLAVMFVLALGFGMAACDGGSTEPPAEPPDEPEKSTRETGGADTRETKEGAASKTPEGEGAPPSDLPSPPPK